MLHLGTTISSALEHGTLSADSVFLPVAPPNRCGLVAGPLNFDCSGTFGWFSLCFFYFGAVVVMLLPVRQPGAAIGITVEPMMRHVERRAEDDEALHEGEPTVYIPRM